MNSPLVASSAMLVKASSQVSKQTTEVVYLKSVNWKIQTNGQTKNSIITALFTIFANADG